MLMFKSIVVNGVRLVVYPDGTILKYLNRRTNFYSKGWNICVEKTSIKGYKHIGLGLKRYLSHRLIATAFLGLDIENKSQIVDHIDKQKSNNTLENLRIVSSQQNSFNTNAKGYSWNNKSGKFQARIHRDSCINLGFFDTKEEAHQAYLEAKKIYHIIE